MNEPWLALAYTDEQHLIWLDILQHRGRPDGGGEPDLCEATKQVIFDDDQAARDAVTDLNEAGAPLLAPVDCIYAEHWHLEVADPVARHTDPDLLP